MMKRILIVILSLLIAVFFVGCGTYTPPPDDTQNNNSNPGSTSGNGPNGSGNEENNDGKDKSTPFTVTLILDGKIFEDSYGMTAIWTGGSVESGTYGVFTADIEDGIATINDLDGDYHVTLSGIPDGYTYDPNGYIADNYNKQIEVELLKIYEPSGGRGIMRNEYSTSLSARITQCTYRVELNGSSDEVWYYFKPSTSGSYTISSWVDITDNTVNPIVVLYNGNPAAGIYTVDVDSRDMGGASSTFTKNFKFAVEIDKTEVGNAKVFKISADSTRGYPVYVDFTIKYEEDFVRDNGSYIPIYADQSLFYKGEKPSGTFRYIYKETNNILDGNMVKLNPDDNYYHLYDRTKYPETDGYGPLLFAKITKDCEVLQTGTDENAPADLGFFWNILNFELNGGMIRLNINGYDYAYMICNSLDRLGNTIYGYAEYCFADDGTHPVTEELKEMLQGYASKESFFNDGDGWAEDPNQNPGGIALRSIEENQWLFACGYYA